MKIDNWPLTVRDQELIDLAIVEDLGADLIDLTSQTLFSDQSAQAQIICKETEPIIVCGLHLISLIFQRLNVSCQVKAELQDGDECQPGAVLATLNCAAPKLLQAERLLLNFLRHLSAIASLTRRYVSLVAHTKMQILDTRKTTPGLRNLEKYAVACGGGVNHRYGLYDAIMLKDTHIDLLGGIDVALKSLPQRTVETAFVVVEVRNLQELQCVLESATTKVDRVLLDNMSCEEMQHCVRLCQQYAMSTEASGNITLDNVADVAATGVDFASIGRLTYSAGQVDLSMQIER